MSNNAPEIRFKGFTDAWVQRKLGEVADIIDGDRGKNYPNGDDFQEQGHTLFLSAANITKDGFSFESNQYITEEKSKKLGNGKLQIDDVVLTSRGSLGHVAWYNEEIHRQAPFSRINSGMLLLRSKENIASNFVEQFLKSPMGEKQLDLISFGSAQPQLTKKDITNYAISVPFLQEQTAIGDFFRTIDDTITLHKRKLDGLKRLKIGYLQQMFPQTGECIPWVRFNGFADPWEVRLIEDFADVGTGGKDTQDAITDGKYDFYVRSPNIEKINSYSFDGEAVLTVGDGVGVGKVFHYVNGKFDYHQRVYKISDFKNVNGLFFYQYFAKSFIKESQKYNAKTSVDSVRREMITKMLIPCPSLDEQTVIGDFFRNLDEQIADQQSKIEQRQRLKAAYLQKMFI